jgi:AraC-like DNA-binding protein
MLYYEHKPSGRLNKHVEKIWYCQAENHTINCVSVPLLNHELIINFSEEYNFQLTASESQKFYNPKSWISGIQDRPILTQSRGQHRMIGVLFSPDGLQAFTRLASKTFAQSFKDPRSIFGEDYSRLLSNLTSNTSMDSSISLVEEFLNKKLTVSASPKRVEAYLDHFLNVDSDLVSVRDACTDLSISNKSLVSSFSKYIGTTPLKFLHLVRINLAINRICADPQLSLTDLAYELNYADQSHFTNSFKSLVGISPSNYAKKVKNGIVEKSAPNFILGEG